MLRALRSALVRFTVRRAAASQRDAPRRADWWLRVGCAVSPAFADCYPALVRLRRAIEGPHGDRAPALRDPPADAHPRPGAVRARRPPSTAPAPPASRAPRPVPPAGRAAPRTRAR